MYATYSTHHILLHLTTLKYLVKSTNMNLLIITFLSSLLLFSLSEVYYHSQHHELQHLYLCITLAVRKQLCWLFKVFYFGKHSSCHCQNECLWGFRSPYFDLTMCDQWQVKNQTGQTEKKCAIKQGTTTWLRERKYEKGFRDYVGTFNTTYSWHPNLCHLQRLLAKNPQSMFFP